VVETTVPAVVGTPVPAGCITYSHSVSPLFAVQLMSAEVPPIFDAVV